MGVVSPIPIAIATYAISKRAKHEIFGVEMISSDKLHSRDAVPVRIVSNMSMKPKRPNRRRDEHQNPPPTIQALRCALRGPRFDVRERWI